MLHKQYQMHLSTMSSYNTHTWYAILYTVLNMISLIHNITMQFQQQPEQHALIVCTRNPRKLAQELKQHLQLEI